MAKGIIDIHIEADTASGELYLDGNFGGVTIKQLTEVFAVIVAQQLRINGCDMDYEQMALLTRFFGQKLFAYSDDEGDIISD